MIIKMKGKVILLRDTGIIHAGQLVTQVAVSRYKEIMLTVFPYSFTILISVYRYIYIDIYIYIYLYMFSAPYIHTAYLLSGTKVSVIHDRFR